LAAVGKTLGGCNALGETQLDILPFHELEQPFAVSAHVAADLGEGGEFLAFSLRDIKNVDTPETVKAWLPVVLLGTLGVVILVMAALLADHGSQNEDAFFSWFHEAAKRVPSANPGDVGGIGLLPCDEQDVAKAVGVEFGHGGEVGGEHFTATGLQSG